MRTRHLMHDHGVTQEFSKALEHAGTAEERGLIHLNMGELYFMKRDYLAAREAYMQAAKLTNAPKVCANSEGRREFGHCAECYVSACCRHCHILLRIEKMGWSVTC